MVAGTTLFALLPRHSVFMGGALWHCVKHFNSETLANAIETALGVRQTGLLVEGSPGQGNWAQVPWAAIFEPGITTSATRGFYPVYLFDIGGGSVHLSLNQGTTTVRQEFGRLTQQVLADRAALMRKRVQDYLPQLPELTIDLGTGQT